MRNKAMPYLVVLLFRTTQHVRTPFWCFIQNGNDNDDYILISTVVYQPEDCSLLEFPGLASY